MSAGFVNNVLSSTMWQFFYPCCGNIQENVQSLFLLCGERTFHVEMDFFSDNLFIILTATLQEHFLFYEVWLKLYWQ